MRLTKNQAFYLTITCVFIFSLVYTPHLVNPFPIHVDEWHHISQAIRLKEWEYKIKWAGIELGFHIFLMALSLFTNLVLIYKFLPAIWVVFTSLVLFFIIRKQTSNLKSGFFISLFAIIFFASIKSNVNITGLWFFIPLTFSIPFIYLYIYFFTEGIRQQSKKYLLTSLIIMLLLIPTHSISVLFAIPILIIFSLFHINSLKKQYKILSLFLLIPIAGLFFFSQIFSLTLTQAFLTLLNQLQFKHGWGVLEINNSPFELYSPFGYLLAILGLIAILSHKQTREKYLIYILWPLAVLTYILIFKLSGTSYISPYQRNLYYFAISLPFLSSFGLYKTLVFLKLQTGKMQNKEKVFQTLKLILIVLTIILIFSTYFSIPKNIKLYKVIDKDDYQALKFLAAQPKQPGSKVMASPAISTAIYPISKHEIVADIFHQAEYRGDAENFFENKTTCQTRQELIQKHNAVYVLSEEPIECSWKIIYQKNNNTIYEIG